MRIAVGAELRTIKYQTSFRGLVATKASHHLLWTERGIARREIEDAIEDLLALLDEIDGDPDLEDGGDDEPSLGWTKTMALGDGRDLEDGQCR